MTIFDISPKFTLFWGYKGAKPGSRWIKTCPSPYKLRYKCYFWSIFHKRGGLDAQVTTFDISPKSDSFWGIWRQSRGATWVNYAPKITFMSWFIGGWVRFYPFSPPVLLPYTPKQGKFGWYIISSHLRILPTSHVKYAPKITFIPWFIVRWARFYPFWPPGLPQYAPKTRQILVIYRKVSPSHLLHLSCDLFPKNNIYTVFFREMDRFLPILTPGFAPICPKNKANFGDISKCVTFTSFLRLMWLVLKNNIYTVLYW